MPPRQTASAVPHGPYAQRRVPELLVHARPPPSWRRVVRPCCWELDTALWDRRRHLRAVESSTRCFIGRPRRPRPVATFYCKKAIRQERPAERRRSEKPSVWGPPTADTASRRHTNYRANWSVLAAWINPVNSLRRSGASVSRRACEKRRAY